MSSPSSLCKWSYLKLFLLRHRSLRCGFFRCTIVPTSTEDDFQQLLTELGYRGYGWLRPEGV